MDAKVTECVRSVRHPRQKIFLSQEAMQLVYGFILRILFFILFFYLQAPSEKPGIRLAFIYEESLFGFVPEIF